MGALLIPLAKAALKAAAAKYQQAKKGDRFDVGGRLAKFQALGLKWDIGIYVKCRGPVGNGTEVVAAGAPVGSGSELTT